MACSMRNADARRRRVGRAGHGVGDRPVDRLTGEAADELGQARVLLGEGGVEQRAGEAVGLLGVAVLLDAVTIIALSNGHTLPL